VGGIQLLCLLLEKKKKKTRRRKEKSSKERTGPTQSEKKGDPNLRSMARGRAPVDVGEASCASDNGGTSLRICRKKKLDESRGKTRGSKEKLPSKKTNAGGHQGNRDGSPHVHHQEEEDKEGKTSDVKNVQNGAEKNQGDRASRYWRYYSEGKRKHLTF